MCSVFFCVGLWVVGRDAHQLSTFPDEQRVLVCLELWVTAQLHHIGQQQRLVYASEAVVTNYEFCSLRSAGLDRRHSGRTVTCFSSSDHTHTGTDCSCSYEGQASNCLAVQPGSHSPGSGTAWQHRNSKSHLLLQQLLNAKYQEEVSPLQQHHTASQQRHTTSQHQHTVAQQQHTDQQNADD